MEDIIFLKTNGVLSSPAITVTGQTAKDRIIAKSFTLRVNDRKEIYCVTIEKRRFLELLFS